MQSNVFTVSYSACSLAAADALHALINGSIRSVSASVREYRSMTDGLNTTGRFLRIRRSQSSCTRPA